MKKIILAFLIFLFSASNIKAQYNSVGYDATSGEWNVGVHSFTYNSRKDEPTRVHCFQLSIENNTAYVLSAIDVEIILKNNGKTFFKKTCQITISPACDVGEVYDTNSWCFGNPLSMSSFGKKFTWSAKVVAVYSP